MGQRAGSKVGAVLDTKNKVKDKANAVKENIKDIPTQTAYAVYSAKEKAKSSVSDFKRGMVQEQQSRQSGRLESRNSVRKISLTNVWSFKRHKKQGRQRKTDGSATTGATRPHERPATTSIIPKPSAEKRRKWKRPATATTSKASEPVKTNVIKERPLSSGASDRKATQSAQPAHRQNVEKVVSQETRQNYTKDRRTKVQQTQSVQKNQQTTEKTRNLVTKKGQKKNETETYRYHWQSVSYPLSVVLFFGVLISADSDDENSNFSSGITGMNLSAEVLKHQPMVEKYARENGISEYVNVLLAIIQVESGGTAEDVMQSSESLGLPPNSLDTESSIKQGCKYFASLLSSCKKSRYRRFECSDTVL